MDTIRNIKFNIFPKCDTTFKLDAENYKFIKGENQVEMKRRQRLNAPVS